MTQPSYNFRWFRDNGNDHEIPAELLADALRSAQRAFQYAGMIAESVNRLGEKLRARIPAEIARKYVLLCHPAIEGSYDVPTTLGLEELVDDPAMLAAASLFNSAVDAGREVSALAQGMISNLPLASLPSGAVGRAFLLAVSGVAPPRGSGWSLELTADDRVSRILTEDAHRRLEDLVKQLEDGPLIEKGTVTGELRAIDFARKQITILHPVDDRELECSYSVADEITLINNRLSLVHVTGRLIRDVSGRISMIDEIDKIEPLDLSPIEVGRVETSVGILRAIHKIALTPVLAPEANSQWMTAEFEPLGLMVTAATRSTLVDAIRDELAFLWEEYVSDPSGLSESGNQLRNQLIAHFEVVSNASR